MFGLATKRTSARPSVFKNYVYIYKVIFGSSVLGAPCPTCACMEAEAGGEATNTPRVQNRASINDKRSDMNSIRLSVKGGAGVEVGLQ